jgi:CDP-glucose 4,6-dehydratase
VRGEAFNFSPERAVSVLEMTHKIQELMGRLDIDPVILNQARAEIKDQYLESSKARARLGWMPQWPLEQGLIETIDWYTRFLGVMQ